MNRIREMRNLLEMLDKLGFYEFIHSKKREEVKLIALRTASLLQNENERVYNIDAELIREQGVKKYIEELSPFLRKIGFEITLFSEQLKQGAKYSININGEDFLIWTKNDDEIYDDPWFAPTIRFFIAINTILERNECNERLYYDCVANDTTIVFLTKQLFTAISQHIGMFEDLKLNIPVLGPTKT